MMLRFASAGMDDEMCDSSKRGQKFEKYDVIIALTATIGSIIIVL